MFSRIALAVIMALMLNCSIVEASDVSRVFLSVRDSVVTVYTEQRAVSKKNQVMTGQGLGSGVLISSDGHILTAAHVVQVADKVRVEFSNGDTVSAKVVSSEPQADLALLKIRKVPGKAVVAKLGDSDAMKIGSEVFVVGAPYGLSYTLTVGHLSARHKPYSMPGALLAEHFQTDAAINQGNSGGPMFNKNGEVIGIVSHILSKSGGFEGLGFATTSKSAKTLLLERRSFWTGSQSIIVAGDMAKVLNIPQGRAFLVQYVAAGSPAERLGLKGGTITATIGEETILLGGDIVLEVMGISVAEDQSYLKVRDAIDKLPDGGRITVKILRSGAVRRLSTTIK